jgi:hypothetical protein
VRGSDISDINPVIQNELDLIAAAIKTVPDSETDTIELDTKICFDLSRKKPCL